MRVLLVGFLLTLTALAGCIGGDDDPEPTTTPTPTETPTETGSATPTPTATQEPEPGEQNTAPTAMFTADLAAGAAPLNITFSFDASDADGDALAWTLDPAGNGTVAEGTDANLPGNFTFTFETPGNYTAVFTVSDGTAVTSASFNITVSANSTAAEVPAPIVFSGVSLLELPLWGCIAFNVDPDGAPFVINHSGHAFDPDIAGFWHYRAEPSSMMTEWWDWQAEDFKGFEDSEGTIPEGANRVFVCGEFPSEPDEYTLTLYHPDYQL